MSISGLIRQTVGELAAEWVDQVSARIPAAAPAMTPPERAGALRLELARRLETHPDAAGAGRAPDVSLPPQGQACVFHAHGVHSRLQGVPLAALMRTYALLRRVIEDAWRRAQAPAAVDVGAQALLYLVLEQALEQAVAGHGQESERAHGMLLAVLGHDLGTPLSAITLATQFLSTPGQAPERRLQVMDSIERGAAMANRIVRDMLEYSSVQQGRPLRVRRQPGEDLLAICQAAIVELQTLFPDCRIDIVQSGALRGNFDPVRLRYALVNLMLYLQGQGTRRQPLALALGEDAHGLTVRLSNPGAGMAPAALARIFDPLVRAGSGDPNDASSMSLGLGMLVARELIHAHDGSIEAEFAQDEGISLLLSLARGQ